MHHSLSLLPKAAYTTLRQRLNKKTSSLFKINSSKIQLFMTEYGPLLRKKMQPYKKKMLAINTIQ